MCLCHDIFVAFTELNVIRCVGQIQTYLLCEHASCHATNKAWKKCQIVCLTSNTCLEHLFFGFRRYLHWLQAEAIARGEPLQHILLDVGAASHIDTTALEAITEWHQGLGSNGIAFGLIDPNPQVVQIAHQAWGLETGRCGAKCMYSIF